MSALREADFNPNLHPRDRRGKFRVGQRIVALGRGGLVIGMVPGGDRKAPHKVKVRLDDGETKTLQPDAVTHMAEDARLADAPEAAALERGQELMVGAYVRRKDGASVRVKRLHGTQQHVVDVNGERLPGTFTRAEAMRHVRLPDGGLNGGRNTPRRPNTDYVGGHPAAIIPRLVDAPDSKAQEVLPGLGVEGRISDVRARIARLEQYRRYGEGYDRAIATHLHDAERFATPQRIDEAEHWIGRAEAVRDANAARRAERAAERAAAQGPGTSLVPVVPKHEPRELPPGPPPEPEKPNYGTRRYADRTDPIVAKLLDVVGSRVKRVTIQPSSRLEMHGSDWDEGQRHQYTMVRLSDMKAVPLPRASEVHGNPFNYNVPSPEVDVPDGFAVVDQQVGYKPYVNVYVNPASLTPMLPEGELDEDVALMLIHTASLKNTYGGEKDIRFNRAKRNFGMTLSRWVVAQEKARAKGWVNKAGAITPSGRNAVEGHPLRRRVY